MRRSTLLRGASLLLLLGLDYLLSTYAQRLDEAEAALDQALDDQALDDQALDDQALDDQALDELGDPDLGIFAQVPPVRRCPCGAHVGPCRCGERARGLHTAHLTAQLRAGVE